MVAKFQLVQEIEIIPNKGEVFRQNSSKAGVSKEVAEGMSPGAKHIPMNKIPEKLEYFDENKEGKKA